MGSTLIKYLQKTHAVHLGCCSDLAAIGDDPHHTGLSAGRDLLLLIPVLGLPETDNSLSASFIYPKRSVRCGLDLSAHYCQTPPYIRDYTSDV